MGKELRKFIDMIRDEGSGGETPPGLRDGKFFSDIGKELSHLGKQGAHELAAALFNGSAFVMYPHAGQEGQSVDDPQHGLPKEVQREQERGGMEM